MRNRIILLALFGFACAQKDGGITRHNSEPDAEITNPAAGLAALEGQPIEALGVVDDYETPPEALTATWEIGPSDDVRVACEGAPPDADGLTACAFQMPAFGEGEVALRLIVNDGEDTTQDELVVEVLPSHAPACAITSPEENLGDSEQLYFADEPIDLEGGCDDGAETAAEDLAIAFTAQLEGAEVDPLEAVNAGATRDGGDVWASGFLAPGRHQVCLSATDFSGDLGRDCVWVEVLPPNEAPTCEILLPVDGYAGPSGQPVTLQVRVDDADDGPEALVVTWRSDHDGELTVGVPVDGYVTSVVSLSDNTHTITAAAADPRGDETNCEVTYAVGGGPAVAILSPLPESEGAPVLADPDEAVFFEAAFEDDETPCEEMTITWRDDEALLRGPQAGDPSCLDAFTEALPEGDHVIRFEATDGDGLTNADNVHVRVEQCLQTWYRDADGDAYGDAADAVEDCTQPEGYVALDGDCDDSNTTINPARPESCNGLDDNCDGNIDEGYTTTTWWLDGDSDGYGPSDPGEDEVMEACEGPTDSWVDVGGDCDDANPDVNPGESESCNALDDNCNGVIDEGFPTTSYYLDADGDGWGDSSATLEACYYPAGYAEDAGDCDDGAAHVNPGETEVCDELDTDEDCDGVSDPEGSPYCQPIYYDGDGDSYYADGALSYCLCDPEGDFSGYVGGECNDSDADVFPGAAEVCDGVDNNCDGDIDEGTLRVWYRDADGDGFGSAGASVEACEAPSGYVEHPDDCNDGNAAVHPTASEICDGVDNNCDGATDEGDVCVYETSERFTPDGTGRVCPQGSSGYDGGDCEFEGHGPVVTLEAELRLTGGDTQVVLDFTFDAVEDGGDGTAVRYSDSDTVYAAPPDCVITGLSEPSGDCSYTDDDHSVDWPTPDGVFDSCRVVGDTTNNDLCDCNGDDDTNFEVSYEEVTVALRCVHTP